MASSATNSLSSIGYTNMLAVASASLIKYIYIFYPSNVMALFAENPT